MIPQPPRKTATATASARRARSPRPDPGPVATTVRPIRSGDLEQIIAIDAAVTGLEKRKYWRSLYRRYGSSDGGNGGSFLVADVGGRVAGFVIGEVRDWEFGSPPCGWVFAIDVVPEFRQSGIGTRLLEAICASFRRRRIGKVRTLLARDNTLILSFFRSQGMVAGPFIPLEMDLAN
jgi:ribosomal protein S18 acetylase RimI-like enzyme